MKHLYSLVATAILTVPGAIPLAADSYSPPCTIEINSQEAFDQWTTFDANNDGGDYQWKYSLDKQGALYTQNKSGAANDWLISPAVTLSAGATYKVTIWIQNLSTYSSDKQKVALCFGNQPTIEALSSNEITKNESLTKASWPVELSGTMSVTTTGEYYFGLHQYSLSYMGDCLVTKISIEEQLTYPGAVTNLVISPADKGVLEATLSWTWPSVNNAGGSLSEISGARIYRGNNNISATDTYLVATFDATSATPGGTAQWVDNTLTDPGKYYYMVVPFNSNGASTVTPSKVESPWIGLDSPGPVANVVATANPENDKAVSITFTYPTAANGGYLDLSLVGYRISRSNSSGTSVILEENWKGALPYIDESIPALDAYTYQINTVYKGSTSFTGVKSNSITTGGTISLPYSNTFDNANSISLWTLLNVGNGSRNWGISSSKLDYWGSGSNVDVYAITPPFALKPGTAYSISFKTYVSNSSNQKPLQVMIGTEPLASSLTRELFQETIGSAISTTKEITFSVDTPEDYYIAFRVNGNISGTNDIYIDDLKIEEIVAAPLAASEFKAEAQPLGAMGAHLSWINPSETNAGTDLSEISSMEIYRDNQLIATLTDVTPGEVSSYTDTTIETPGVYTYTLTPYLNTESGAVATASTTWVGPDTPKAPESVTVTQEENGDRSVAFTLVTESVHGGYVDFATMTYTISRNEETISSEVKSSPFIDSEENLELASYVYGVTAVAGDQTSAETLSNPMVFGEALSLPYQPDFNTSAFADLWTFENPVNPTKNWKYNATSKSLQASFTNAGAWAITPPFKALAGECEVSYKATCYNSRYSENLELYLISDLSDLDGALKIADYSVTSVSYPNVQTTAFSIPTSGVYHIGYKLVTPDQWTCNLLQSDIRQSEVLVGVDDVTADFSRLRYDGATQSVILPAPGNLDIFSPSGMLLLQKTEVEGAVSTSGLPSATYIAVFRSTDGSSQTLKFVK